MEYEIRRLNFGSVRIDAAMRLRGLEPGNIIEVPAQGFLLFGPGGPILVDAGYRDPSVLGMGGTVAPGQGFEEQLSQHGLSPADLNCVILTHLHRDHAGHVEKVPMDVPVVVNRSELACAATGLQGTAYAKDDIIHLIERTYTFGAMRILDLETSGPQTVAPGVTCHLTGGHTAGSMSIVVSTREGEACLCGDLFYDVEGALLRQPRTSFTGRCQPSALVAGEPALTNNFTTSVVEELGAVKRALRYRFLLPAHDDPAVLEDGRYVGRITGDVVPGPVTFVRS
ncbi:N-acyl homoserine lactonase family protein [Actinomadura sp. SCN-SB]|uniref:N-acyl homoserine lactonase family protein n=1 Tax=Actinomadura sp. SCN-SB TaxID=3373092 RepID=UPI003753C274